MRAREVLKILQNDGWYIIRDRGTGSHMQLKHPIKPGKVTLPMHSGDVAPGTLKSIFKQAGIEYNKK